MKIGEILLSQGFITEDQLEQSLEEQKRTGISLGTVLVNMGAISEDDLTSVLGTQIALSQRKRLGEILIDQSIITPQQLDQALAEQKRTGWKLGQCLVHLRMVEEEKLTEILAAQMDVPHVVLANFNFNASIVRMIPEDMARKYKVIPLFLRQGVLTVAMADPTNLRTLDHLKFKTGKEIDAVIATEKSITAAIERQFSAGLEDMTNLLGDMKEEDLDVVRADEDDVSLTDEEGAQVVKIVNVMVAQAITERASDIHLEPMESFVRLRYRIDGDLQERNPIPNHMRNQIISRLKIMSGMDIAERRRPQDGRFMIRHEGREIDLRVNTFPVMLRKGGIIEKVVMRIIDPEANKLTIDDLGFMPRMRKLFEECIEKPNGILLVTGPTGSGKSSTLYAGLQRVYTTEVNIVTMEDPVEFNLDGINQGQINPKAGFTFAEGMRSILRQDPDIIMLGEMRDLETSEMAVQAALTGHLVLSTLHTNDAASAFTRLLDMGIEPFLITSCVIGVLAQRLVRRICSRCAEQYDPDPELLQRLGLKQGLKLYRGKGCGACKNTGYKGRMGIYEFLVPDEEVQKIVMRRGTSTEIMHYCIKRGGFDTLRRDGLRKALEGRTTVEQVLGATQNE
ncbi:MAG: type II/IV secretion system protein [Chitinivibrionales bacterium]|nr:type II/IV secretion system protein [Chitinivibrionales bacterium]